MDTNDPPPADALLGDRYRLGERVGQGGMATVYRAEDVSLGRTVAIKLLRPEVEGASTSDRARGEMTVLASLNHPGLVTLYDAQLSSGGAEYLVMEFVDGPTLAARIRENPLSSREAAVLAEDLAGALHVVHGAGIVHRDIKPSNVLLSQASSPGSRSGAKLADFGISVLVDGARLTSPGIVVGSAAYLAPEQLKGAPPAPAADIYSFGLVLREALTGTRAFPHAEGIGEAMVRLNTVPEIPDSLGPEWGSLLTRMTALDPAVRPTALEVFEAASALAGRPATGGTASVDGSSAATALLPAAGAAAAAAGLAAADAAATGTAPMTAPTQMLPAGAAVTASQASPRNAAETATEAAPERRRGTRRLAVVGGLAGVAVAAAAVTGIWLAGNSDPSPAPTSPIDTEQTPAPSTSVPPAPVVDTDEGADDTAVDETGDGGDPGTDQTDAERKAAEKAAKEAEKLEKERAKAEEEAQREAEKQAEEEQRAEEEDEPIVEETPAPIVEEEVDPIVEQTPAPVTGG
ncbi:MULTISPECIES: serine/threonine-protein kinase [unclassified Microbacterium]|uniref:serine/threonine-protein kinase n=1 Tax=unclassified Microbacterium TaxID=2609290 RepID=UPI00386E8BCC